MEHDHAFLVWDPMDGSEAEADRIEAPNAAAAAELWAAGDVDGLASYSDPHGVTLHVLDPSGALHRFRVNVELCPRFFACELDETAAAS